MRISFLLAVAIAVFSSLTLPSCVSQKKYAEALSDRDSVQLDLDDCRDRVARLQRDADKNQEKLDKLNVVINDNEKLIRELKETIEKELQPYDPGLVDVEVKNGKAYITLSEKLLFQTGKAVVNKVGIEILGKVAGVVQRSEDLRIYVEGHTDDVAIRTAVFKDNWDLSVYRSTAVIRVLMDHGLEPTKMTASGMGEYQPVATNETPQGRSQNRRTEIVIAPKLQELYNMISDE